MRHLLCAVALASFASAGVGQQPNQSGSQTSQVPVPETVVPPECTLAARPAAAPRPGDSLCVSLAGAIAGALIANPQIQVAGAQVQQARAARVQGVALPDPTFGAEWDGAKAPFGIGGMSSKVFGASIVIPFFDKFRLHGRIGTAGIQQS